MPAEQRLDTAAMVADLMADSACTAQAFSTNQELGDAICARVQTDA